MLNLYNLKQPFVRSPTWVDYPWWNLGVRSVLLQCVPVSIPCEMQRPHSLELLTILGLSHLLRQALYVFNLRHLPFLSHADIGSRLQRGGQWTGTSDLLYICGHSQYGVCNMHYHCPRQFLRPLRSISWTGSSCLPVVLDPLTMK